LIEKEENKNFGEIIKDCQETNDKILIKLKEIRMLAEGRDDSKKSIFYESYQYFFIFLRENIFFSLIFF